MSSYILCLIRKLLQYYFDSLPGKKCYKGGNIHYISVKFYQAKKKKKKIKIISYSIYGSFYSIKIFNKSHSILSLFSSKFSTRLKICCTFSHELYRSNTLYRNKVIKNRVTKHILVS